MGDGATGKTLGVCDEFLDVAQPVLSALNQAEQMKEMAGVLRGKSLRSLIFGLVFYGVRV